MWHASRKCGHAPRRCHVATKTLTDSFRNRRLALKLTRRTLLAGTPALLSAPLLSLPFAARAAAVLTVGLIPSEDSRAMIANSQAMMDMLSKSLGMPVKPFVAADYNGVIEALRSKRLDVAYLGPFSYVLGATVAEIEAFAVAETKKAGRTSYHSADHGPQGQRHQDRGRPQGQDLRLRRPQLHLGPPVSQGGSDEGGLQPRQGLRPRHLLGLARFQCAMAVQNKKVEAVAIADRILDAAIAKGLAKREDLVVVWKSDPIPESPTVWRKDLDPALKKRVQAAFLDVKDIPWSDQGLLNGFHPTNDAAYNVIRDTAKLLNLDLRKMK